MVLVAGFGHAPAVQINAQAGAEEGLFDVVGGQGVAGEEHVDVAARITAGGTRRCRCARWPARPPTASCRRRSGLEQFPGDSRMASPLGFSVETLLPMKSKRRGRGGALREKRECPRVPPRSGRPAGPRSSADSGPCRPAASTTMPQSISWSATVVQPPSAGPRCVGWWCCRSSFGKAPATSAASRRSRAAQRDGAVVGDLARIRSSSGPVGHAIQQRVAGVVRAWPTRFLDMESAAGRDASSTLGNIRLSMMWPRISTSSRCGPRSSVDFSAECPHAMLSTAKGTAGDQHGIIRGRGWIVSDLGRDEGGGTLNGRLQDDLLLANSKSSSGPSLG